LLIFAAKEINRTQTTVDVATSPHRHIATSPHHHITTSPYRNVALFQGVKLRFLRLTWLIYPIFLLKLNNFLPLNVGYVAFV
jgi:hypothetical protein